MKGSSTQRSAGTLKKFQVEPLQNSQDAVDNLKVLPKTF